MAEGDFLHLSETDLLDLETRKRIVEYIKSNPFANYTKIRRNLEIANGVLDYNLHILEKDRLINSTKIGKNRCYYLNHEEKPIYTRSMFNDTEIAIMNYLNNAPGTTGSKISSGINMSRQIISWNLKKLHERGVILREKNGISIKNYLNDNIAKEIDFFASDMP